MRSAMIFRSLAAAGLAARFAAAAGAAGLALPADLPVAADGIGLDLDLAAVEIVVDPSAEPRLTARLRSEAGGREARLRVEETAGSMVVYREGDGEAELVLRLTLSEGQRASLAGSALEIVVRQAGRPGDAPPAGEGEAESPEVARAPAAGAGREATFDFDVERSDVQLFGVAAAVVTAAESSVFAEATAGSLALELTGGSAEIRDHQGALSVQGRDAELSVDGLQGRFDFELAGGSATVRGGRGNCIGAVRGGSLELDGWNGSAKLNGTAASFEVRSPADGPPSHATLVGVDLEARVGPFRGSLVASLRGGRLQVRDQQGNTKIHVLDDGDVTVEGSRGEIALTVQRSTATVSEVPSGIVKANVIRGRLDVDRVHQLEVVAGGSQIHARHLERLRKVQATDSYLELDLSDLQHNPRLELLGSTEAWVTLATPCSVKLDDEQLFDNRIEVSGCRLEGGLVRRDRASERGVEGNRRLRLTAKVAKASSLRVEGSP